MHALLVWTLAKERGRDVADAHHLGHRDAEHALDVIADGRDSTTRFAARDDVRQPSPLTLTLSPEGERDGVLLDPVGQVLRE